MTEKPRTGNQQGTSRKERGPMTLGGDNSVSLLRVRVGADEGGRELGGAQDSSADTRQHPRSNSPGTWPKILCLQKLSQLILITRKSGDTQA